MILTLKQGRKISNIILIQVRHSRRNPFTPNVRKDYEPELYYSLSERLKEKDKRLQDPERYAKVNIGFSCSFDSHRRNYTEKMKVLKALKQNLELEKQAKECTLKLNLDEVDQDSISSTKPIHLRRLAENYDIYKHLFGDYAYFYPVVHLNIFYNFDDETVSPVYAGNLLKPRETSTEPIVEFESDPTSLWTLILSNPDGNLLDNNSEMIHWFLGNIPGGLVRKGEVIIDYLQPIPPKGTGFHRYCFVLYKQKHTLNFSKYQKKTPCLSLEERTFKTYDFYKEFEDELTPAGLAWFQADYDSSLVQFFHKTLKMKEPTYEYEFPKPYIAPQKYFPMNRSFNRYLDLHRDPKETQKLMLLKRLARVHPFQGEKPLLPFPQAVPIDSELPIWLKKEIRNERLGKGKFRDMYRGDDRPYFYDGKIKFFPFSDLKGA